MREYNVPVLELYLEHRIRQGFFDYTLYFYCFFFTQIAS